MSVLRKIKNIEGVCRIYTLKVPGTNNIFYVGKTLGKLKSRLDSHLSELNYRYWSPKKELLFDLTNRGIVPEIEEVDFVVCKTIEDHLYCLQLELYWISQFKAWGFEIVNIEGIKWSGEATVLRAKQYVIEYKKMINNPPIINVIKKQYNPFENQIWLKKMGLNSLEINYSELYE